MEGKTRIMFDHEENTLDFRKLKATDAKLNTRIILPRALSNKHEMNLELRRLEWSACFQKYFEENCDNKGMQDLNLTKEENTKEEN